MDPARSVHDMDACPTFRSAHFLHTRSQISTSLLVGKKDSTFRVMSTRSHQQPEGGQSCPVSRAISAVLMLLVMLADVCDFPGAVLRGYCWLGTAAVVTHHNVPEAGRWQERKGVIDRKG